MKNFVSTVGVLSATLTCLALWFAISPFDRANDALDRAFGALPAWTQVSNVYRNPTIQEVSRGDHPMKSFQTLGRHWANRLTAIPIMLMGNSQTLSVSLARGERPASEPEKTYGDLIADHFHEQGGRAVFYRLSAGGLSYEEMLWYATYVTLHPEVTPRILLIQMNYQTFANGGIREGMLEMLNDQKFRSAIESLSRANLVYSDTFAQALGSFDQARSSASERSATEHNESGGQPNFGYALETRFRQELSRIPGFERRQGFKESFLSMLLRCRSYFLHLQQASRRSLSGSRVEASRAALDSVVAVSQRAGIRVILFQAPTNPAVPLYRTLEDDRSYHDFASGLQRRHGLALFDFEHSVPNGDWGMALNAPDPLHLSRAGHRILADLMVQQLERNGI